LATATCGGAGLNIVPSLATPSEPPIAPMLAAIATQAASSAKRLLRDGRGDRFGLGLEAALQPDDSGRSAS
jgi:hypothetical protein